MLGAAAVEEDEFVLVEVAIGWSLICRWRLGRFNHATARANAEIGDSKPLEYIARSSLPGWPLSLRHSKLCIRFVYSYGIFYPFRSRKRLHDGLKSYNKSKIANKREATH